VVGTRIPEISGRAMAQRGTQPGLFAMLRDGVVFVRGTPLVRGLVIGIIGAFAAGGAVIACAKLYSTSLGGGDAAYGLLFASLFVGLGLGMAIAPLAARRIRHRGLFGLAIVAAGAAPARRAGRRHPGRRCRGRRVPDRSHDHWSAGRR
jgi:dTMP kinase